MEKLLVIIPMNLGMRFYTVYDDNQREGMFFDKLKKGTLEYVTNHTRDFIHMEDCLDAIELLVFNPEVTGVIDVGSRTQCKNKRFSTQTYQS